MAKGLGILMITYDHIVSIGTPVTTWMTLFKITIFYIVAGYMFAMQQTWRKYSFLPFLKKQFQSLMIPYFNFSAISIVVRTARQILKRADFMPAFKTDLFATFTFHGISTLWFLPTLFIGEIVFFLILKTKKKALLGLTAVWPILICISAQNLLTEWKNTLSDEQFLRMSYPLLPVAKGLTAVWFLLTGYLSFELLKKLNNTYARFALGIVLSIITVLLSQLTRSFDFNNLNFHNHMDIFFIGGISGSIGAILVFEFLEKYFRMDLLTYWGRNSLILMVAQRSFFLINLAYAGWKQFVYLEDKVCARYYAETTVILILVLLTAYGIAEIINHKMPFLLGKRRH
jgi:fucose 4-O-acetylase-like acetyltransferase